MENLKNTVYDLVCGCKDKQCARRRAVDRLVEAAKEEGAREERERIESAMRTQACLSGEDFDAMQKLNELLTNNHKKRWQ